MGSFLLNGRATLLFLVFLGTEVWAERLRKNHKPDIASCFLFQRTDGSVIFQWPTMDKELFWLLTVGWILGLFPPFCMRLGGPWDVQGRTTIADEWRRPRAREEGIDPVAYGRSYPTHQLPWQCTRSHAPARGFRSQSIPNEVIAWGAWLSKWLG